MSERNGDEGIGVVLDGMQLATLNGAAVILCSWSFEKKAAREIVALVPADDAEKFTNEVGELTRNVFNAAGLWPGDSPWTQELMSQRAKTSTSVSLQANQIVVAITALRASAVEFRDRWWEFCTVAPGGLEMYGVAASDLLALADDLERHLTGADYVGPP